MNVGIDAVSEKPELAPLVAEWRVGAFFDHPGGYTVEEMTALILKPPVGPEETFVLFDGDRPVGTAGLNAKRPQKQAGPYSMARRPICRTGVSQTWSRNRVGAAGG